MGQHQIKVEVTINGQQYTDNQVCFQYNQVDPNLTDEDLKRMDEEEQKNAKKGGKKK